MGVALGPCMAGVNRFEDLDCWKLASELSDEVDRITEKGRVARDVKFRNQIRESAASAPSNISEGWGRYFPNQNAPYVRIAKGSLEETVNHLMKGKRRKYFAADDFNKAFRLAKRALGATTRYLLYLESCGKEPPDPESNPTERTQNPEPEPEPRTGNRERSERRTGNGEPGTARREAPRASERSERAS